MKKYSFTVMFAFVLIFALAGCGKGSAEPASTTVTEEETGQTGQDVQKESDQAGTDRPVIGLSTVFINEKDKSGKTTYLTGSYDILHLVDGSDDKFKALSDKLDQAMDEKAREQEKAKKEYVESYKQDEYAQNMITSGFEMTNNVFVHRADSEVLSAVELNSGYTGGAHGYFYYDAWNYDAATGKEITLDDVVADKELLAESIKTELKEKYPDSVFNDDMDETIKNELNEVKEDGYTWTATWTLDPQGITFYYSPYQIGSWAAGSFFASIPYSSEEKIFTDKYRPQEGEGYILTTPLNTPCSVDVNHDGKADQIQVSSSKDEETDTMTSLDITVNDEKLTVDDVDCFEMDPKIVLTADGRAFLYTWCKSYNDYVNMYIVDLSSGKPESVGIEELAEGYVYPKEDAAGNDTAGEDAAGEDAASEDTAENTAADAEDDGSIDEPYKVLATDPAHMKLATRFNILSTYDATRIYKVADTPVPVSDDSYYTITGEITLTSVKDIEAPTVDEQGKVSKKAEKIPAGSTFTLVRTDGEKIVDARLADGSMVRLTVTGSYPQYIDGVDANELFERLFFAG